MSKDLIPEQGNGSPAGYIVGFVLSLVLTLVAYVLVDAEIVHGQAATTAIITLALTQLFVQLVFFLHLNRESKPRWNLTVAAFAVLVVLLLVLGSLWIMQNLNYHHDGQENDPHQTDSYILKDEGVGE